MITIMHITFINITERAVDETTWNVRSQILLINILDNLAVLELPKRYLVDSFALKQHFYI